MDYFKRERMAKYAKAVQSFISRYLKRESTEEDKPSKIETYFSVVHKVLIWEDPFLSGVTFFVAHVLFWIVVQFQLKLYGIIFMSLFVLFIFDAAFDSFVSQTDRSLPLKNIRETIKFCTAFLQYLTSLRREHPGLFCVSMCTAFLILSIIGRTLSGLFLSYFGLISVLLLPGVIYRLPPEVLDTIRHTLHLISTNEGIVDENELFPTAQEEFIEEKDADCDSLKTDHTADSCTNSFISGVTSMPSYLEAEGSLDGLEEDDLEFTVKNIPIVDLNNSSDSDSEHKDIKFESSHFNKDSSDEEQYYEQGLTFTELETVDRAKPSVSTQHISADFLSNLGSMGSSLISTVLNTAPPPKPKRTDSDSDFEIIDTDDIKADET